MDLCPAAPGKLWPQSDGLQWAFRRSDGPDLSASVRLTCSFATSCPVADSVAECSNLKDPPLEVLERCVGT